VVLPAWNAERTIARALESVRAQTWTDWELIVVDDGSTDGTRDVLRGIAREEPRLRVLEKDHAGVAVVANAAMATARGEFIARMDADDVAHPERLAEQVSFLERTENTAVAVVGCLVEFGGDRAANAGYALHVDWSNSLMTSESIALNRFVEQPVVNPSVMLRRELLVRHGGFRDGDFPEDYELWLRWLDAGVVIAKVPRALLRWNDSPGRLTRTDSRYTAEAFFALKAMWIARWLAQRKIGAVSGDLREVYVWGAGRHTRKRAAHLERHGVRIAGYIDIDPKKTSAALGGTGRPVITPEALPAPGRIFVLGYVGTRGAREVDREQLRARGYVEGRDFLMCA
jgi:glycosyltransferase involved in cell wall biosynthesis